MKQSVFITCLILLTAHSVQGLSQCKCTPNNSLFPGADTTQPATIQVSLENEVIGSTDVGKLLAFGQYVILQNLGQVNQYSPAGLSHKCPANYSPLTKADLQALVLRPDFNILIGTTYLNLTLSTIIFSSDKVYPNATSGSDNNAYEYHVIKLDALRKPTITTANAYWTKDADRKTICRRNKSTVDINLDGYEGYDLEEGKTYELKVNSKNVLKYYVEDSNGKVFTTQTFSYTHKGNSQGCAIINIKLQVFGGDIAADCLAIWTKPQFAFNAGSSIQASQIKQVILPSIKANVNNGMFFSPGSVPVSPIVGDSSSVYLYYSEKTTNALKVMKLSKEGVQIGSTIDTQEIGTPFDIVSTTFGFVVMATDSNQKLWISAFNTDGTLKWKRVLTNNGKQPTSVTDQIKFYTNDKCELPFGMQVMFNPHNGRLIYARGRIHAIWAHYNHFGIDATTQARNDHTGDTFISLDSDTGFNQKVYWAWGTSHSLYQNLHYDGKSIYVGALGDAYPTNINFQICDIEQNTCKGSSTIIPGVIVGNGGGMGAGRQGSFMDIIGNRNEKFFIYQRKKASSNLFGEAKVNDLNELAMIRFGKDLKLISTVTIISGDIASRINSVKTVKYGKNILIAYSLIPASEVQNFNRQNINQAVDESYIMLINGDDGSTLYGPQKLDTYQVNSGDDWRILEDGRVVYTLVDKDNNVKFYYTPGLITPDYPNPIKSSDKIYGFGNFINSKVQPPKNNYNDVCVKQGDSNFSLVDQISKMTKNDEVEFQGPIDLNTEKDATNSIIIGFTILGLFLSILI